MEKKLHNVANIDPNVMHIHTKLTISLDFVGCSCMRSVYLPSVNKSAVATCKLIATNPITYSAAIPGVNSIDANIATAAHPITDVIAT